MLKHEGRERKRRANVNTAIDTVIHHVNLPLTLVSELPKF